MSFTPKFDVRNPEVETMLKEIGQVLKEACSRVGGPRPYGFALLLFEFGPNGSLFYTSNGDRDDVVAMLREFIAKSEKN